MARPLKLGLDYFPFDTSFDDEFRALEELHGNDGFTWMIKFWQSAYKTEDGVVDLSGIYLVLGAKTSRISSEKQGEIIADAIKLGLLREVEPGKYTSNGIQKRMAKVNTEREKDRKYHENKQDTFSSRKPSENHPKRGESKVKESKEKNIKAHCFFSNNSFKNSFEEFTKMRQRVRKPMTDHAKTLILEKLEKYPVEEASRMLDQSTERSWLGVFPLKQDYSNTESGFRKP